MQRILRKNDITPDMLDRTKFSLVNGTLYAVIDKDSVLYAVSSKTNRIYKTVDKIFKCAKVEELNINSKILHKQMMNSTKEFKNTFHSLII